ncbi:multivesicular body subunit 12B-like [Liolophura sinensis]|uniref:multivesicular body subunit 12B-like n=1 Tax=Liolophura sinensis TaxID=3198878 RepID=UPI00315892D4
MQDMRDALPGADVMPVTGLCIVADPSNCPPGHTLIDKTYDRREDADLWKDRFFGRRITRYMCMENSSPTTEKDILVDITVINEKDPVPAGYACQEYTQDTREKAMKKKQLCLRWMNISLTQDAISEIMLMSRGRRTPAGFTLVGELNNLQLCFKMGQISRPSPTETVANSLPPSYMSKPPTYTMDARLNGPPATQLPYGVTPNHSNTTSSTLQRSPPGDRHLLNPLAGIPWQLNPKLTADTSFRNDTITQISFKSYADIENQYSYKFTTEHSAAARMPPELS